MATDWTTWGRQLGAARRKKGWSQAELAERVQVARNTIARLEMGTRGPSLSILDRLSRVLRVPVATLLAWRMARKAPRGRRGRG
jgi:transcriptional regulator with XRE-family HTH domain